MTRDTWQSDDGRTCWHATGECPTCGGPVGTDGDTYWCCACGIKLKMLVPCEVFSRVVGYISPVQRWNDGKVQEFSERKTYEIGAIK